MTLFPPARPWPSVAVAPVRPDGQIFRSTEDGQAWRYRGVSAFPLCRRFTDGMDIRPFLATFADLDYNVLRVWDYVTWTLAGNGFEGWESCSVAQWAAFLDHVGSLGWMVELTLCTDDDPNRLEPARRLVDGLTPYRFPNLCGPEIGNEPKTHKNIDTEALREVCQRSGYPYSNGVYEDSRQWFGTYGTAHTPRDYEWPRKAHDLLEYWSGGGPNYPQEPACRAPWVADEPIRPDQATPIPNDPTRDQFGISAGDYYAYGATCALLGAGATFHAECGKSGTVPEPYEVAAAGYLARGLTVFPADAPLGPYSRIDEGSTTLRTYVVGPYSVRIRPTTLTHPYAGWTALDLNGICWRKG